MGGVTGCHQLLLETVTEGRCQMEVVGWKVAEGRRQLLIRCQMEGVGWEVSSATADDSRTGVTTVWLLEWLVQIIVVTISTNH